MRILIPVSLVKRWPISASFLSEAGAKFVPAEVEIAVAAPGGRDARGEDPGEAGGRGQEAAG